MRWLLLLLLIGCATGQAVYVGSCDGLCLAVDGEATFAIIEGDTNITLEYNGSTELYGLIVHADRWGALDIDVADDVLIVDDYLVYVPTDPFHNATLGNLTFFLLTQTSNFHITY